MAIIFPLTDAEGNDRYYWDQTSTAEAKDMAVGEKHPKREAGRHAPFGDNTYRVIDSDQGVVAYTGTLELAQGFVAWLMAHPQPVEVPDHIDPDPKALAEWEQHLLNSHAYREGVDGTGYIIRKGGGKFDVGDAFAAIREHTGWGGVVLLSTTYWKDDNETGWQDADEVRWFFQKY